MHRQDLSLTDIGANLCHDSFDADRDAVLARAAAAGVDRIVVTGSCAESSAAVTRLAGEHAGVRLYGTVGLHPHHATDLDDAMLDGFRQLSGAPGVVALGEMGLDYNRDFSPREIQRSAFERQLDLAVETGQPCFLHQRDAHADFLALLKPRLADLPGVVVHCFTGSAAELEDYIELDVYVGITGWICDERRGQHLLDCVHRIPDTRILIETDAPYLLPRSLRPRPKSRRNEPMYLSEVAATVARARGQSTAELARLSRDNATRLFRLDD